jgi:O-acetyl-ADP-ribose deacetylase (regulator of RNase III)
MNKFILVDNKAELAQAWKEEFGKYENFEIHGPTDIFDHPGDAVVSPANSFGFMDGGIDLLYSMNMGWHLQENLQKKIYEEFNGELLVGQATTIPTGSEKYWKNLIVAPTMRVPLKLVGTPNVYLSAKAIFLEAKKNPGWTIVCPGLGTGTGSVSPKDCAIRMRMAYEDFYLNQFQMPKKLFDANFKHEEELTP